MLSEQQIQLKAQQYLQKFQQTHQNKQNLLKSLEAKVNNAAKTIQKIWKKYLFKKRNRAALKIQKIWKIYKQKLYLYKSKVNKFKQAFFKGKIAWFIFSKYFKHKIPIKKTQKSNQSLPKYQISSKITKNFPPFINISQTYASEISYIQKLRVYEKQKFSQSWQEYQQKLKKQLQKEASKKWVKKNQTIWITQENKQINLEEYIQKNVEKIFEREYNKYKEADLKLQNTTQILKQKINQFTVSYYRAILPEMNQGRKEKKKENR